MLVKEEEKEQLKASEVPEGSSVESSEPVEVSEETEEMTQEHEVRAVPRKRFRDWVASLMLAFGKPVFERFRPKILRLQLEKMDAGKARQHIRAMSPRTIHRLSLEHLEALGSHVQHLRRSQLEELSEAQINFLKSENFLTELQLKYLSSEVIMELRSMSRTLVAIRKHLILSKRTQRKLKNKLVDRHILKEICQEQIHLKEFGIHTTIDRTQQIEKSLTEHSFDLPRWVLNSFMRPLRLPADVCIEICDAYLARRRTHTLLKLKQLLGLSTGTAHVLKLEISNNPHLLEETAELTTHMGLTQDRHALYMLLKHTGFSVKARKAIYDDFISYRQHQYDVDEARRHLHFEPYAKEKEEEGDERGE